MRLVIVRFRDPTGDWFVGEKDERISDLTGQPIPATGRDAMLAVWSTRDEACEYARVVTRLLAEHPERTRGEICERARAIVKHG